MNLPKWAWILVVVIIIFAVMMITNFHFGGNIGVGSKTFSAGVQ